MTAAHVEAQEGCGCLPFVEIDTSRQKSECPKCGRYWIEAHFIGRRGLWKGWRRMNWCGLCRWNYGRGIRQVDPARDAEQRKLIETRELYLSGRLVYRDDHGHFRCALCKSTLYRYLTSLQTQGHPVGYIVEWICWQSGHTVLERWKKGSPVGGRFPIAPLAPKRNLDGRIVAGYVEAAPSPPDGEPPIIRAMTATAAPKPSPQPIYSTWRTKPMQTEVIDVELRDGCDARCIVLKYRDPHDARSPIYLRRMHDPDAHNAYNREDSALLDAFMGDGIYIRFSDHHIEVDGVVLDGTKRQLTPTEWRLLRALAQHVGKIVQGHELLRMVWGDHYSPSLHLLRVNMTRIRAKLDPNNPERFIVTATGIGYRLGAQPNQSRPVASVQEAVLV
jgi:DNA-binding winged helix-turn-helix (wHTH) protein